ncbi:MAG: Crp/Fnr family transcriptional regulator [Sphingomicrobium sp.]|nr:Crp/Fnr family transcriptional regulator [Sphingomonadales bacterium]
MIDKLLVKLRRYDDVSSEEEQVLRAAAGETIEFRRGQTIVKARTELSASTLLIEGLVHSFKDLGDGSRQTVQLAVPGDFIDLHSLLMKQVDHNLGALSNCRVVKFPHERLIDITQHHAHLARLLWLSTVIDGAIERETIMSLGIRSSVSRLAHLFCELQVRFEVVGLAESRSYDLQLNQEELSEILGMTPVHINRMLKELRERGLLTFRGHVVEISDWNGLVALAEFDPFYLDLRQRPR